MAVKAEVQIITEPGTAGQVTYNTAGGFGTPKIILATWTEQTTAGNIATMTFSMGMATYRSSTVSQRGIMITSTDGSATSDPTVRFFNDSLVELYDVGTTTRDGQIDFISFNNGQFTLDWVELTSTGSTILTVLVLGGDDITDAEVDGMSLDTTNPQDKSFTAGFGQPDLILSLFPGYDAYGGSPNVTQIESGIQFGAGIKDGEQRSTVFLEDAAVTTMDVGVWQQSAFILQVDQVDPSVEDTEVVLNASSGWPTDGIELGKTNAPGATVVGGLGAIKGDFEKALAARTTPTSPGTSDYNVGFTPKAAIFWGSNVIPAAGQASPIQTATNLGEFWVGFTDGTTEVCRGFSQEDAVGNANTFSYYSATKAVQTHNANTAAVLMEADASFVDTTVRLDYTTADATSREIHALVIGETFVPPVSTVKQLAQLGVG